MLWFSRVLFGVFATSVFVGSSFFVYWISFWDQEWSQKGVSLSSAPSSSARSTPPHTSRGQSFDTPSTRSASPTPIKKTLATTPDPIPPALITPKIRLYAPTEYQSKFPKNTQALQETLCQSKLSPLFDGIEIVLLPSVREPRASIEGKRLTLGLDGIGPAEVTALLIHEWSHHYDLMRHSDRSAFTRLSWQTDDIKKPDAQLIDFVSGYALTNNYEDFAESVTFYLLFERDFYERAQKSEILMQKYLYIHKKVFGGDASAPVSYASGAIAAYHWDTTRIPFDQKKYAKEQKMDILLSSCFEAVEYRGLTPDL